MKKLVRGFVLSVTVVVSTGLGFPAHAGSLRGGDAPPIGRSFVEFWDAAKNRAFPEQEALWNKFIEGPREEVYRSIVWETRNHPNWRQFRDRMLRDRFESYRRIGSEIPGSIRKIESAIRVQAARFGKVFGKSDRPFVILLLAPNFDAKSGVLPGGKPVLALAVDTLILEKADLEILLPHEFFHVYDAEHSGIENDGVMPGTRLTLPLFAEGLATYVSTVMTPGHTDAQYFFQDDLGALPDSRLPAAAKKFLADANTLTIDPARHETSPVFKRWFQSGQTQYQSDLPNRAGYWLGLHVIRVLRHKYSLREIAAWAPVRAQAESRIALTAIAAGARD